MSKILDFFKTKKLRFSTKECGCFFGEKTNSEVLESMTEDEMLKELKIVREKVEDILSATKKSDDSPSSTGEKNAMALKLLTALVTEMKKTVDLIYDATPHNTPLTDYRPFVNANAELLENKVDDSYIGSLQTPPKADTIRADDFPLP